MQPTTYSTLYALGFSKWKRAFIDTFAAKISDQVVFIKQPPKNMSPSENVLIWGNQYPEHTSALRVEDGFIRSSGLGSDLMRPASLVFDDLSLYFNAQTPSRLLDMCHTFELKPCHEHRGKRIIHLLQQHDVSKYNLKQKGLFNRQPHQQRVVLVVGQVDNDASIVTGSPYIKSNEALLRAVRQAEPDAYLLYKPHPDVLSHNRTGEMSDACISECVDQVIEDCQLSTLYPHIDALHTMTSLSGLEALIRGVTVITWGQPFYSGWGLTDDRHPLQRQRTLTLAQLVYIAFVEYAHYIDWSTRLWITPEVLIEQLAHTKIHADIRPSMVRRYGIKARYLLETLNLVWQRH